VVAASSAVSERIVKSHLRWGHEWRIARSIHHTRRCASMARTSKLTAIEVARAKGAAVLHEGGGAG
jgi:hypothetical protein